jgi:MFS transporter, putative metabolite:H+ symporter
LFVGVMFLGHFADSYGRRTVFFTFSSIRYSITTAIMAFPSSGFGVDLWRPIAGIGIGVELVTIDTSHCGRAYAYNQFLQFLAVPIVTFFAWLLIPHAPLGLDGWRRVVLIGSAGAIVI